jgi:hypothetical protein
MINPLRVARSSSVVDLLPSTRPPAQIVTTVWQFWIAITVEIADVFGEDCVVVQLMPGDRMVAVTDPEKLCSSIQV